MISITLKRSGGMLGKTLQASGNFDIAEPTVSQQLSIAPSLDNSNIRDGFTYRISINGGTELSINPTLTKGSFRKILDKLEDDLKAD